MKRLVEAQNAFYADRPVMSSGNTLEFLIKATQEEAAELADEPPEYISREVYLLQECADVILFAMAIIRKLGHDPEQVVMEKVGRNICKYPAKYFQNGRTFEAAISHCKNEWTQIRGNEDFYSDTTTR